MKKEFELTYKKLIILAILLGVYTALMAIIPTLKNTSFADITISFEVWILCGIFIIKNSNSAKDSAIKCFLFFLISQPLVYLLQVPFTTMGFNIFSYYKTWFIWTILTIPMGFIGYYMKKDKWWGLIILTPILLFLGFHYSSFLKKVIFMFPYHLLSTLFCTVTLLLYPTYIFKNKIIKSIGTIISVIIILIMTIISLTNKISYSTEILTSGGKTGIIFNNEYKVYLENPKFGNVYIKYDEDIEDYLVYADFNKGGKTNLILEDKNNNKIVFELTVNYNTYEINKK